MEDKENKEFIDGFNKGYLIRKYDAELHENIADSLTSQAEVHPLVRGMIEGAKEAEFEIRMDELGNLRSTKDKGQDLDK